MHFPNRHGRPDGGAAILRARPYHQRKSARPRPPLNRPKPQQPGRAAEHELVEARPCYERALAIREKALGPDHPNTALSLNNLGALLQAMGDLQGARPYFERALAIFTARLGPDHPHTHTVRRNLAALAD
jgi:tetratricopeptide (TPR) repeat protein